MYVEREVDGSRNCPWNITLFRGRWLLAWFTVLSSAVVRPLPLSRDSLLLPAVHFLRNGFRRIRASAATLCCFSQPKHSRSTQQTGWHFRRRTTCRSPCPHGTTLLMLSAEFILALRPLGSLRYCTSHPILPLSSWAAPKAHQKWSVASTAADYNVDGILAFRGNCINEARGLHAKVVKNQRLFQDQPTGFCEKIGEDQFNACPYVGFKSGSEFDLFPASLSESNFHQMVLLNC